MNGNINKAAVIALFGTGKCMAGYIGVAEPSITRWPDELAQKHIDRVETAYSRFRLDRTRLALEADSSAEKMFGRLI